ncbi:hypothetical protein MMC32_008261 [Xylographa parallela]|nr:hypothetical protein [Xylographa parallela]
MVNKSTRTVKVLFEVSILLAILEEAGAVTVTVGSDETVIAMVTPIDSAVSMGVDVAIDSDERVIVVDSLGVMVDDASMNSATKAVVAAEAPADAEVIEEAPDEPVSRDAVFHAERILDIIEGQAAITWIITALVDKMNGNAAARRTSIQ